MIVMSSAINIAKTKAKTVEKGYESYFRYI